MEDSVNKNVVLKSNGFKNSEKEIINPAEKAVLVLISHSKNKLRIKSNLEWMKNRKKSAWTHIPPLHREKQ